jgi:hypothetical protein
MIKDLSTGGDGEAKGSDSGLAMGAGFGLVIGAALGDPGIGLIFGAGVGIVMGPAVAPLSASGKGNEGNSEPGGSPKTA